MRKLCTLGFILWRGSAFAGDATVQDHYKTVINKKPYQVEVCQDVTTSGDKSLSIRWALLASQSLYKSKSYNLLISEDVLNTLKCLKKLGVKIKLTKNFCEINGLGLNGFKYLTGGVGSVIPSNALRKELCT